MRVEKGDGKTKMTIWPNFHYEMGAYFCIECSLSFDNDIETIRLVFHVKMPLSPLLPNTIL